MRIAYLVLIHKDPGFIARLCKRLTHHTENHVFVHVDAKVDSAPFKHSVEETTATEQIHFVKSIPVYWGDITLSKLLSYYLRQRQIVVFSIDMYCYKEWTIHYGITCGSMTSFYKIDKWNLSTQFQKQWDRGKDGTNTALSTI